jgi:hypothetical protein
MQPGAWFVKSIRPRLGASSWAVLASEIYRELVNRERHLDPHHGLVPQVEARMAADG